MEITVTSRKFRKVYKLSYPEYIALFKKERDKVEEK